MRIPADVLEDAIRFRKQLAGETELSLAIGSAWNGQVIRRACEECGATEAGALEVHHIRPRRIANAVGRLEDGSDVHCAANLRVLCEACHDKLHAGEISVSPLVQTSDGPERSEKSVAETVETRATTSTRASKWSAEELNTIAEVIRKFPSLTNSRMSNYLLTTHEIHIHASTLGKMRNA